MSTKTCVKCGIKCGIKNGNEHGIALLHGITLCRSGNHPYDIQRRLRHNISFCLGGNFREYDIWRGLRHIFVWVVIWYMNRMEMYYISRFVHLSHVIVTIVCAAWHCQVDGRLWWRSDYAHLRSPDQSGKVIRYTWIPPGAWLDS